jgi:chemotaxis protein CheC
MELHQKLTKDGLQALEKMSHKAAKKASLALSNLSTRLVKIHTINIRTIPIKNLSSILDDPGAEIISPVLQLKGDVEGVSMLIYPQNAAFTLADILCKKEPGATKALNELDKSALMESGNIVTGAFLSTLSDYLQIIFTGMVPSLKEGTLQTVIEAVIEQFKRMDIGEAISFEIDFSMGTQWQEEEEEVKAYFVLFLDEQSTTKMFNSLRQISGGKQMRE